MCNTEVVSFAFMLLFILIDIILGIFYSKISHTYKSSIMRTGFYHKIGFIGMVLLFYIVSLYMQVVVPNENLIDMFKLTECSSLYVIVNEIGSIKETLQKIIEYKK